MTPLACPPPPTRRPKFLNFHAVFSKNWQNHRLAPPPGSWHPFLGEILDPPLDTVQQSARPRVKVVASGLSSIKSLAVQWRIQDIPEEVAPTLRWAPRYDFIKISRKLHEIKENLAPMGGLHPPLDPPLHWTVGPWPPDLAYGPPTFGFLLARTGKLC